MAAEAAYSVALAVPAEWREKANALGCALGYDTMPGNLFSRALSKDGSGSVSVTHYAFASGVTQAFIDVMDGVATGQLPPTAWGDYGLTVEDILEIVQNLHYDKHPVEDIGWHYAEFLRVNDFVEV